MYLQIENIKDLIPVNSLVGDFPRTGQWVCDLVLKNITESQKETINYNKIVTIYFSKTNSGNYWKGIIQNVGSEGNNVVKLRIIGGEGKLTIKTAAKQIKGPDALQNIKAPLKDKNVNQTEKKSIDFDAIKIDPNRITEPKLVDEDQKEINFGEEAFKKTVIAQHDLFFGDLKLSDLPKRAYEDGQDIAKRIEKQKNLATYKKNVEDTHNEIAKLASQTSSEQHQQLNKTSADKQLDKSIKKTTNNSNSSWRYDIDGKLIYVRDNNQSVITNHPTSAQFESTDSNGRVTYCVKDDDMDYFPYPGTWYKSPLNSSFCIQNVTVYYSPKIFKYILCPTKFNTTLNNIVNKQHEDAFQRNYTAQVKSQNDDGTLNLIPSDNLIKGSGIENIPIRTPFGVKTVIETNADVNAIVQYENNDPGLPYVIGFYSPNDEQFNTIQFHHIIGDPNSASWAARSDKVDQEIQRIWDFLQNTIVLQTPVGPTSPGSSVATPIVQLVEETACETLKIK
jgi:hypothetical protein